MFDSEKYPNVLRGHNYALDIISGVIPASIYTIGACNRYLNDLEREKKDDCPFYFDPDRAERYLSKVQKFNHVSGDWTTSNITYMSWQCFTWMCIKGFIRRDTEMVRFRTAHVEVARGNAKSTQASQAVLYDLCLDSPKGNHVYCAATRKEQARLVLDSSRAMAKDNDGFLKSTGTVVQAHQILHDKSNSYVRAISAEAKGLDGKIGKLIVADELHAMRRDTFEVLDSGQSKRRDSLLLCITTAGYDTNGVGHSQSTYAKKVCLGETLDDTFFALVYTIDKTDDPFDPSSWVKANPGFGEIVDPVNFEAKANKAKENPQDLNGFLIKHLNVWTNAASPYFNLNKWDECADETLDIKDFTGKKCFAAIDLASKVDLTSFVFIFKTEDNRYALFDHSFIPEETLKNSRNDGYREWEEAGYLTKTQGSAINYPKLQEIFKDYARAFRISGAMFDPWNCTEFATRMSMDRVEMLEFKMSTANLSEPMKKLDALIREKRIIHNGSPLLRWCLGNVVAKLDHNDNVFPRKDHEDNKIDPIIASIMAIAGYVQDDLKQSVYETRGIRFLN